MKRFKKKHTKIPSREVVQRLLKNKNPALERKYNTYFDSCPAIIPEPIRIATLAEFDPVKRQNIRYYPDLHNFEIFDVPNRSLPVPKFLNLFRPYLDNMLLDQLEHDLSNFRLEFHRTVQNWVDVYADDDVHSCMSGSDIVRCYVHPQNKLALAALYAPGGGQLLARTIVNTEERWWVRLFGDSQPMSEKLMEQGYKRLTEAPRAFRMYGWAGPRYTENEVAYPYFDFQCHRIEILHDTHNRDTGLVEVIINPGNLP